MGTAIGMWICLILAIVSFIGGLAAADAIGVGLAVLLAFGGAGFFLWLGMKTFNEAPEDLRRAVGENLKEEEYKKMNCGYKCPSCGRKAGHPLNQFTKGLSVGALGLASNKIGKTYQCANCDYMW